MLVLFGLSSCVSSLNITVIKPAAIDLSSDVKKISVVDNTMRKSVTKRQDVLEGVLTGEQIGGDRKAVAQCMRGITAGILDGNIYNVSNGMNQSFVLPDRRIDWETISKFCDQENAQLLVVVEDFDSDAPMGGAVLGSVTGASGSSLHGKAIINVYYPKERLLREQINVEDVYEVPASGTPKGLDALSALEVVQDVMVKKDVTMELGYNLGYKAGAMFYPNRVWVSRRYYGRGSKGLKQAKKMIRRGNWDIAEQKLKQLTESPKRKEQKRAIYNLALAYEGKGDLDNALKTAEIAALEHDVKLAYDYIDILKRRKRDIYTIELQESN